MGTTGPCCAAQPGPRPADVASRLRHTLPDLDIRGDAIRSPLPRGDPIIRQAADKYHPARRRRVRPDRRGPPRVQHPNRERPTGSQPRTATAGRVPLRTPHDRPAMDHRDRGRWPAPPRRHNRQRARVERSRRPRGSRRTVGTRGHTGRVQLRGPLGVYALPEFRSVATLPASSAARARGSTPTNRPSGSSTRTDNSAVIASKTRPPPPTIFRSRRPCTSSQQKSRYFRPGQQSSWRTPARCSWPKPTGPGLPRRSCCTPATG